MIRKGNDLCHADKALQHSGVVAMFYQTQQTVSRLSSVQGTHKTFFFGCVMLVSSQGAAPGLAKAQATNRNVSGEKEKLLGSALLLYLNVVICRLYAEAKQQFRCERRRQWLPTTVRL